VLMYWITRVWFFARRRALHEDPILFALHDVGSWCCLAVAIAIVVLASIRWPGGNSLVQPGKAAIYPAATEQAQPPRAVHRKSFTHNSLWEGCLLPFSEVDFGVPQAAALLLP
jgi:hypothetical protein